MSDRFDIFGESCYFCGGDVLPGRSLCWICALHHTEQEVTHKRAIANIIRQKNRETP